MTTTDTPFSTLLTAEEVAERCFGGAVSPAWILREARAGRLRCLRLGRRIVFRPEAVSEWIEERENG